MKLHWKAQGALTPARVSAIRAALIARGIDTALPVTAVILDTAEGPLILREKAGETHLHAGRVNGAIRHALRDAIPGNSDETHDTPEVDRLRRMFQAALDELDADV